MKTNSLPELKRPDGIRGGYRLFSIYDGHQSYQWFREHGAVVVTRDGWNHSTSSLSSLWSSPEVIAENDGKHTSSVFRVNGKPNGPGTEYEYHELHGQKWDTREEAVEAAFRAGVLQFLMYEDSRLKTEEE